MTLLHADSMPADGMPCPCLQMAYLDEAHHPAEYGVFACLQAPQVCVHAQHPRPHILHIACPRPHILHSPGKHPGIPPDMPPGLVTSLPVTTCTASVEASYSLHTASGAHERLTTGSRRAQEGLVMGL